MGAVLPFRSAVALNISAWVKICWRVHFTHSFKVSISVLIYGQQTAELKRLYRAEKSLNFV